MAAGAQSVAACASHAVFSGKAVSRITESPLSHVVVTNTIPLPTPGGGNDPGFAGGKVRVKSVGRLLGEAIKRIHHGDSISSLFV
jgi:ribose-phosphate pyrophosphokinase